MAESLLQDPPEGTEVVSNISVSKSAGERTRSVPRLVREIGDELVYLAGVPRFLPTLSRADLIHTISGLVPTVPRPWISSISMPSSFFGLHDDWYTSPRRVRTLNAIIKSRNCRKITCFSRATLEGLSAQLGTRADEAVRGKLEVLYPATNPTRYIQKRAKDDGTFRILFVGNLFFDKGGRELHKAVSRLSGRYDVELTLVADAPLHHKAIFEEFRRVHNESWVKWHVPGVTRKELVEELYPKADVFVMCSYVDVFGFVLLEAMASGLPVMAADCYAQREIVDDGINGFLIRTPTTAFEGTPSVRTPRSEDRYRRLILSEALFDGVVDQLEANLTTLIENDRTRKEMGRKSLEMTTDGRFSIRDRNRNLKRMYEEAVGN